MSSCFSLFLCVYWLSCRCTVNLLRTQSNAFYDIRCIYTVWCNSVQEIILLKQALIRTVFQFIINLSRHFVEIEAESIFPFILLVDYIKETTWYLSICVSVLSASLYSTWQLCCEGWASHYQVKWSTMLLYLRLLTTLSEFCSSVICFLFTGRRAKE